MRVVVDTNVVVSALLREGSPPAQVLDQVLRGDLTLLYDHRILAEYAEVLARPKFSFDPEHVRSLLSFVVSAGIQVPPGEAPIQLPDPDDQPFADVAFTGGAVALITGNKRDFPLGDLLPVLTAREWLSRPTP